ncbi:hypothetical protein Z043_108162 [Scleropages formosus]|uniref:SH2 domain-containing adapter protein F n=1 Tax=Scleropages formosus TaxID=113540 RepID=A0A0P7X7L2_SCLFO|nr:hypothetical protein Z043_108162 [Scleropages formosus]
MGARMLCPDVLSHVVPLSKLSTFFLWPQSEIRGGRSLKDGPLRQLPLYDTPYEPAENGGDDSDPERPLYSRESRLPQDDERPPEEYDQPWEWKRDRISKAFAVEIKVIKDLPWPPPVGQLNSAAPLAECAEEHTATGQPASDQHHRELTVFCLISSFPTSATSHLFHVFVSRLKHCQPRICPSITPAPL